MSDLVHRQGTAVTPLPNFMHIQKAAGHTVRALLHANYGHGAGVDVIVRRSRTASGTMRTPGCGDPEIAYLVAELRARQYSLDFIATNLSFGLQHYLDRELLNIAFLRDPVERCISYWYFCYHHQGDHPGWSNLKRFDFDVDRLFSERELPQFSNAQVRMLAGTPELDITAEHLAIAKDRIASDFLFVGCVDRMDACIEALGRLLNWKIRSAEHRNASSREDSSVLPTGAREVFMRENQFDAELYSWLLRSYLPERLGGRAVVGAGIVQ